MKHITECHIEQFVRYPDSLSRLEREIITKELTRNPELRALALWFAEFYDEVESIKSNLTAEGIIRLQPIKAQKTGSKNRFNILAAMTPSASKSSLETVATLASEEKGTVARILKNHADRSYKLHLIRPDRPSEFERSIFTIETINVDLVINESRHLSFDSSPKFENLVWDEARFLLREYLLTLRLTTKDVSNGNFSTIIEENGRRVSVSLNDSSNTLVIKELESRDIRQPLSRVLISKESGGDTLYKLNVEGETAIPIIVDTHIRLKFYT